MQGYHRGPKLNHIILVHNENMLIFDNRDAPYVHDDSG